MRALSNVFFRRAVSVNIQAGVCARHFGSYVTAATSITVKDGRADVFLANDDERS